MCIPLLLMAMGPISQGMQAKSAADANANYMRQAARDKETIASREAADQKTKARRVAAQQTVAGAASGVDPTAGTMSQLTTETAQYGELDALRITNNAAREAWGLQTQANISEWQGQQAEIGGYIKAGTSLLGAATNAYFGSKKTNN